MIWRGRLFSRTMVFLMLVIMFSTHSPDVAIVELTSPCSGRCLRCGLPIRPATLPSPRCSALSSADRPLLSDPTATGSRYCDVTSGPRECPTFEVDVDDRGAATSIAAKKRVRFAPPTDDVTDDVTRQLEPVTPPPPSPLPGSSFIKMQTARSVRPSQLPPSKLTTFVGPPRDASVV